MSEKMTEKISTRTKVLGVATLASGIAYYTQQRNEAGLCLSDLDNLDPESIEGAIEDATNFPAE